MQLKCREKKSENLPEFLSVGFKFKSYSPKATFETDEESQSQNKGSEINGFDFQSGERQEERAEVISNELDILEYVRFTETFEELDTLTIHQDLVRDPENFI